MARVSKVNPNKKIKIAHFINGKYVGSTEGKLKDVRFYDSKGNELGKKNASNRNGRRAKSSSAKSKH